MPQLGCDPISGECTTAYDYRHPQVVVITWEGRAGQHGLVLPRENGHSIPGTLAPPNRPRIAPKFLSSNVNRDIHRGRSIS